MDNNSGFCFREICSPGDSRLSKFNIKSEGPSLLLLDSEQPRFEIRKREYLDV